MSSPMSLYNNNNNNNNNNNKVTNSLVNTTNSSSSSTHSLSSSSFLLTESDNTDTHEPETTSYSPTCCYNSVKLNPPFDSAMALTVLVLLTALFFMGFFSIYIRRFADEDNVDPTRRRRRAAEEASVSIPSRGGKGVASDVVESLPVYRYGGGDVEKVEESECAICLGVFEEKECVKEIPYCGHVFHVECIDTWLFSHVSCPLCRTVEFFPPVEEKEKLENKSVTTVVDGHVAEVQEVVIRCE